MAITTLHSMQRGKNALSSRLRWEAYSAPQIPNRMNYTAFIAMHLCFTAQL